MNTAAKLSNLVGYVERTYKNSSAYFLTHLELMIGCAVKKGLAPNEAAEMRRVISDVTRPGMSRSECVQEYQGGSGRSSSIN